MTNSIPRLSFSGLPLWVMALAWFALLMLVATIFYPFGYDQAVFSVEMVMKSAVPYRDFLDTKPPLIFYIYGSAIWIFGRHEWSIHLFDVFFQLGSAFYFFRILRSKLSIEIALLSVSLTLILYSGSGFWMTAEAESFALLPSLILLDMTLRSRINRLPASPTMRPSIWRSLYFGLLAGVAAFALILLKFTFVFGLLAVVVYVLLRRKIPTRTKLAYLSGIFLSFAMLTLGSVYAMSRADALQPFLQSLHWLSKYASIGATPLLELIFVVFPQKIIYSASATLVVLGLFGIISFIRGRHSDAERNPMLGLLALTFVFQIIGVLIERKIEFPYQYTRALWAFTPFAAIGLIRFIVYVNNYWNSKKIGNKVISVLLINCNFRTRCGKGS